MGYSLSLSRALVLASSSRVPVRTRAHERISETALYPQTIMRVSGASAVSNEMQEVRVKVVHSDVERSSERERERGERERETKRTISVTVNMIEKERQVQEKD